MRRDIEVLSAELLEPGRVNPKEAVITLRNTSEHPRNLEIRGTWETAGGASRGGASSILSLAPGDTEEFSAGTRSRDAARFRVSVTPAAMTAEHLQGQAMVEAAGSAQGYGVAYTPTPKLDQIPAWTPRGLANGEPFNAASMIIMPLESGWKMEIHDRNVDPMKGVAMTRSEYPDVQTVYINLPGEPDTGKVFERELEYGGGMFQIKKSAGADSTTSWNTSVAWVIEFTEWDKQPWQEGGWTYQQGGTASGRLYVCFQGAPDRIRSSFVAGEFKDVPIMYYGRPRVKSP